MLFRITHSSCLQLQFHIFVTCASMKHTDRNTHWAHSSILLVSSPGFRTKTIGRLKGIHLFIQRNIQYVEIKSNCPGVSSRKELRLYPLKSRKDSPSLLQRSQLFALFSIDLFLQCLSVFLYHISVFNLPLKQK